MTRIIKLTNEKYVTAICAMASSPFAVYRSLDNGQNWVRLASSGGPVYVSDSCWVTPMVGFIICSGTGVYRTTDGGDTWELVLAGNINAIDMVDAQHGWVCGNNAVIKRTDTGGDTWTTCTLPSIGGADLNDIAMTVLASGERAGVCVGLAYGGSAVILTMQLDLYGNEIWVRRTSGVPGYSLYRCAISETGERMVASDDGSAGTAQAIRSSNSGVGWKAATVPGGSEVNGLEFVGPQRVIMACGDYLGTTNGILISNDGGEIYAPGPAWGSYTSASSIAVLRGKPSTLWIGRIEGGQNSRIDFSTNGGASITSISCPDSLLTHIAATVGDLKMGPALYLGPKPRPGCPYYYENLQWGDAMPGGPTSCTFDICDARTDRK